MPDFTRDRHVRRTGDDYIWPLAALLPQGLAWPRHPTSVLMRVVKGLARVWGYVDDRQSELLERETDPRKTIAMLTDWERAFGLPDECFQSPVDEDLRRKLLIWKMTLIGAQSRQFYIDLAALFGYTITIREYA